MTPNHFWAQDAIFYHIYPLGFCDAPLENDFSSPPSPRLEKISSWISHLLRLGVNALYLGPLFESSRHGYDIADYYQVDRRLGSREDLQQLIVLLHANGIRVVLDGVFNHVGRDFWAFKDVIQNRSQSNYRDWFKGLRFDQTSPLNDPFAYEGWENHYDLVELNLSNPAVRQHLFQAVRTWIKEFAIDGLRLDVAYTLPIDFMQELASVCRQAKSDFWLLGEVVHGNYRQWANPQTLDSVTNYECYKGLYSSLNDKNYFEIAYSLNRQFGQEGLYQDLPLYNFVDNHDVERIASQLSDPGWLNPLYTLLFTMPGIPSIYYGSEFGIQGKKMPGSDAALRPSLNLEQLQTSSPHPGLLDLISRLATIRWESSALRYGSYQQLFVSHQQLAFLRQYENEKVIVVLNAAPIQMDISISVPPDLLFDGRDMLNSREHFQVNSQSRVIPVAPTSGRILKA